MENRMENLIVCGCGSNTWLVSNNNMKCTSCMVFRELPNNNPQNELMKSMGIPATHPNALDLAQAHLDRLKKKEEILKRIQDIIDKE